VFFRSVNVRSVNVPIKKIQFLVHNFLFPTFFLFFFSIVFQFFFSSFFQITLNFCVEFFPFDYLMFSVVENRFLARIRMDSGLLRVARGVCGAKAPPLAARPTRFLMREHSKQKTPRGGGGSFDQLCEKI